MYCYRVLIYYKGNCKRLRWLHIILILHAAGSSLPEFAQAQAKMINRGIMLNVSKGNFTHKRFLRANNTVLTSKDYEFVNFLYAIASNAL